MTTSMTPTHGDPLRHGSRSVADGDPERWLPDPSWPVPPRGWQLWAAAGSSARPGRAGHVGVRRSGDESEPHTRASMDHTDDVTSEMPRLADLEEASFTLPTRPSALVDLERVDLLADRPARRVPEGALAGFAVLGALVLFSCLVGGLTGGLIVIGVSTLLAASAALVRGHLSLSQVGGQRGAGLLLGAAVTALIVGSVATHDRRPGVEVLPSAPVPVSSERVTDSHTAYAAVPSSQSSSVASVAPSPRAVRAVRSTDAPAAAARPTPVEPAESAESAESAASDESAVSVADVTPPPTPRADASVLASGPAVSGQALTLKPDALSPAAVAPSGGTDPKGPKGDKAGKAGKDPKSPKASKAAKDSKKGSAQSKGAKSKGAKNKNATLPTLSDAGIGGSGAATTSVTGFSVTPGMRADTARHQGVATLAAR
ncbi:hypothetical protein LJR027_000381 [Terrabacter sp. LjRoot27]|uniref:hypothetical protein n=1 Tax=Terrabacter sp. LjRoot27 TaxID=3342306 RepID=UPI003ECC9F0A